jgi:hypothetical protein
MVVDRLDATDQGKRKFNNGYTQYYVTIKDVDSGTSNCWYNLAGRGCRMKMTVVTQQGNVVFGAVYGHIPQSSRKEIPPPS